MTLSRSTPEAQGVSSAGIVAFLDAIAAQSISLHSLMVLKHSHVVAEGWWAPYGPEHPHLLYSLSKSFAATAAGLAIGEGRFTLEDRVTGFFPDDLPDEISDNLAAMRVRDLLAMATGHTADATGATTTAPDGNWVRAFLAQPVEKAPGTHFVYNSAATYMVSAIVEKTTGEGLLAYLTPRLLAPLGIEGAFWETCPRGIAVGGWGLSVRTEDIARFGQLYLARGGALLPPGWVEEATRSHIANGDNPESDWNQGYGFQFWRCRHNAYRGDGAFGQFCIVLPDQDAVIAITSGVDEMQGVLNLVWEHLLPALEGQGGTDETLGARLAALALPLPEGAPTSPLVPRIAGHLYQFPDNDQGLKLLCCDQEEGIVLTLNADTIAVGSGLWKAGITVFHPLQRAYQPIRAAGAWSAEDTFVVHLCYVETPFVPTITLRFEGDRVFFSFQGRMGFGPAERPVLEGHA